MNANCASGKHEPDEQMETINCMSWGALVVMRGEKARAHFRVCKHCKCVYMELIATDEETVRK